MDSKEDLIKYSSLLASIPEMGLRIEPTFLEISRYPHYENVISNILKFFFDPWAKHGLGTLFLEALLETAGQTFNQSDLVVDSLVKREERTDGQKRLDLVISTTTLIVGIENKVFDSPENDFNHYKKHMQNRAYGRKVICVLLSLYPIEPSPKLTGFKPVTYTEFIGNLRKLLNRYEGTVNQHYKHLLLDFMRTLENLRKESIMPELEFRDWVARNQDDIENLLVKVEIYKGQLANKVTTLKPLINIAKHEESATKITPEIYEPKVFVDDDYSMRRVLVYDFEIPKGLNFSVEASLSAVGWNIDVVCRTPGTLAALQEFLKNAPLSPFKPMPYDWMRLDQVFDYNIDQAEIASKMQAMIDHVITISTVKPLRRR